MEAEKIRERLHNDESLRDRVARRAFEIYAHRGYQGGRESEDWLQAEREVFQQLIDEDQHKEGIAEACYEPAIPEEEHLTSVSAPPAENKIASPKKSAAGSVGKEAKKKVATPKKASTQAKSASKKPSKPTA